MKVTIYTQDGKNKGEAEIGLREDFTDVSPQVLHDVVVAYLAAQRSGTACTKTVAEVKGSGKKPWRQKGTGRARAGYARSPVWRKGGVVFGPKPRDYDKDVPRRVRQIAFDQALFSRIKDGDVIVLDSLSMEASKKRTQEFAKVLKSLKVSGSALVVHESPDESLRLASRNMDGVKLAPAGAVNTYQLLNFDKVVLTRAALEQLASRTQKAEARS